jgi:demethylmenaquinone methyltransferase/2-methoxy-6-polyprenyl-1,4-benzoquinol methylase
MPEPRDPDLLVQQQELFTRIARRYDLVNHLMTGWLDNRWRRIAVKHLQLPSTGLVLDAGSGNGQLAREVLRQHPQCQPVAADLTQAMLEVGRLRDASEKILWTRADSTRLPFRAESFEGIVSGFLVRNLNDIFQGLQEQYRVLKPGGRIAVLETSRPPKNLLSPLIRIYMNRVIPVLGGLITGYRKAYAYLDRSTEGFLRPEELASYLAAAGFKKVAYQEFASGVVAVYWGEK